MNEIPEFQKRILEEAQELAERLNKLNAFMASTAFIALTREEKDLLYEQSRTMNHYLQILGQRLDYYNLPFVHK